MVKGILVPSCQFLFFAGKEKENYFILHGCMVKDHAERSVERIFRLKILLFFFFFSIGKNYVFFGKNSLMCRMVFIFPFYSHNFEVFDK